MFFPLLLNGTKDNNIISLPLGISLFFSLFLTLFIISSPLRLFNPSTSYLNTFNLYYWDLLFGDLDYFVICINEYNT